jgi:hypothetical protein
MKFNVLKRNVKETSNSFGYAKPLKTQAVKCLPFGNRVYENTGCLLDFVKES